MNSVKTFFKNIIASLETKTEQSSNWVKKNWNDGAMGKAKVILAAVLLIAVVVAVAYALGYIVGSLLSTSSVAAAATKLSLWAKVWITLCVISGIQRLLAGEFIGFLSDMLSIAIIMTYGVAAFIIFWIVAGFILAALLGGDKAGAYA